MQIEHLENNKSKLTFEVGAERFSEGIRHAYSNNKARINIPGFRKGKAPRQIIEMHYGKDVFYNDAIDYVLPSAYEQAADDSGLEIVAKPEIDIQEVGENGVVFTAVVYTRPDVKLGQYKGLEYTKAISEVTEEDIEEELKEDQEKNARIVSITERPVEDGDTVIIDFIGYVDGQAFDGGQAEGYELKIGSGSFIDTFEQQLIGSNIGESLSVNVTFPEDYHAVELAAKPAMFQVTVHEISTEELPLIDDEFAQDVSEFDTLEEYKEYIKQELSESKAKFAKKDNEEAVIKKLLEVAEIDLQPALIDERTDQMLREFSMQLKMSGISPENFLRFTGQDAMTMRNNYRDNAEHQIRARYALLAVAAAEGIQVSEEERRHEAESIAQRYDMPIEEAEEILKNKGRLRDLDEDLLSRKALDLVLDSATAI